MKTAAPFLLILVLALSSPCFAQNEAHRHDVGEKLGSVVFPHFLRSGQRDAQFERGVALLHSFEYEQASKRSGNERRTHTAPWPIGVRP